jgi:hypothetical protein
MALATGIGSEVNDLRPNPKKEPDFKNNKKVRLFNPKPNHQT